MKNLCMFFALLLAASAVCGKGGAREFTLSSPNGVLQLTVATGQRVTWSLARDGQTLIAPSPVSMTLDGGRSLGVDATLRGHRTGAVEQTLDSPFYTRSQVRDHYNSLELKFREGFALQFRAYDSGIAYRFATSLGEPFTVLSEQAVFDFGADRKAFIPYVRNASTDAEKQFFNSFENTYAYRNIGEWTAGKLAFLPIAVEMDGGVKVCITESDLGHYPGMFMQNKTPGVGHSLEGVWAPYPKSEKAGGHINAQMLVTEREQYIAKREGAGEFPWRVVAVSSSDEQLADNDLVWLLASPSRLEDDSWIKPGKVAWEWWNNWNITGVDFAAGINNDTYKAYIDFASKYGMEYIILDEGWAESGKADLFQVIPQIDLAELIEYGNRRNVGIILWAGYWAFARDMERVCSHYAAMGVKGFKVDFMDRDDQPMVEFHHRAAETAARHKLLLDFHGTYKPTGLNRTWPNVINFEGVHGLEQCKWIDLKNVDQVTYDVTMPFIRQLAGPVDYTQGAMRNANRKNFRGVNDEPMSPGTRCRQLAEYVIFFSPLNMLCDSPTAYMANDECTRLIAGFPTVWDDTRVLTGRVGEWIAIARRSGGTWYVGALTGWDARTLELDLDFLGEGEWSAEVFMDGVNAGKVGTDYRRKTMTVTADSKVPAPMAPGGGFLMRIVR
jgi:alpha-glucosidase